MRPRDDDPLRWREATMDRRALPARAAALVDAVREEPSLPPDVLGRIKADILAQRPSRRRALPLGLRLALLTALVLASVATAKGTMVLWHAVVTPRLAPTSSPLPRPERAELRRAAPARRAPALSPASLAEPVAPPPPMDALPPASARDSARDMVAVPAPQRSRRGAPPSRRVDDDATTEAQFLARALFRLRQQHDARGALVVLDEYAHVYPGGVLAAEALSARLEAVVALGDRTAALRLLDERKTFAGRLGGEQLLTRAELRASADRYAEALGDFDRLLGPLASAATPGSLERALYGRAVCFGRLGRDERARADLEAYRTRYPAGTHAAEVARLLRGGHDRP